MKIKQILKWIFKPTIEISEDHENKSYVNRFNAFVIFFVLPSQIVIYLLFMYNCFITTPLIMVLGLVLMFLTIVLNELQNFIFVQIFKKR